MVENYMKHIPNDSSWILNKKHRHFFEVIFHGSAAHLKDFVSERKWIGSFKTGKVWKLGKVFSYFVETLPVLKESIHLNIITFNHCLLHFLNNLVRKIYIKMSQNWKNVKTSRKTFFMNFSDIFMWVIVGENTSLGSVLDTI